MAAGITKSQYDSIVSKKRIQFGKFKFVDIDDNAIIPEFKCCNGIHCISSLNSPLKTTKMITMTTTTTTSNSDSGSSPPIKKSLKSYFPEIINIHEDKENDQWLQKDVYTKNSMKTNNDKGPFLKQSSSFWESQDKENDEWLKKNLDTTTKTNLIAGTSKAAPQKQSFFEGSETNDKHFQKDVYANNTMSTIINNNVKEPQKQSAYFGGQVQDNDQWLHKGMNNTTMGTKTNSIVISISPPQKQNKENDDYWLQNNVFTNNTTRTTDEKQKNDYTNNTTNSIIISMSPPKKQSIQKSPPEIITLYEDFDDDDEWWLQKDDDDDIISSTVTKTNSEIVNNDEKTKDPNENNIFQNDEQLFRNENELQNFMATTSNKLNLTRNDMHGKFKGFIKDNGDEFQNDYALLDVDLRLNMYRKLKNVFGFNNFRHRQKSAVVAALLSHDCFILMPTGAGKSLCYILPALLMPGVTVIITPLRSLMEDQIMKLKNWNIPCAYLKAGLSASEVNLVYTDLLANDPRAKLLYVTPEMICSSSRLEAAFKSLYSRRLLARFVVDEAHCISQWGHDFRPDYTRLTKFFEQFTEYGHVPIAGLTATATPKIVTDARNHLGMIDSKFFISSFVRPNLIYNVMEKSVANFKKLIGQFKITYQNGSGIVYCLSRKDCETTAELIGSDALPYHSELSDSVRLETQKSWMMDKVKIICATIAFGMGIDKPDVRFVIHHSLSQSIESYYQETGRAGRDGKPSHCVLLYNFNDHLRVLRLFELESGKEEMKAIKRQNLTDMLHYCENVSMCRRKMLVEHFGEIYDAEECKTSLTPCTLCAFTKNGESPFKLYEFTDEALAILESMKTISRVGLIYIADVYRGGTSRNKAKIQQAGHDKTPMYERGAALSESDAQRFIRKLVIEGYLRESVVETAHHSVIALLQISNKGIAFLNNRDRPKICFHITVDRKRLKRKSNGTEASVEAQEMFLVHRIALSEAEALKEKYRVKNLDLFRQCQQALTKLFEKIAQENNFLNYLTIISLDGIEQLAALMPRTNSELLQVDTMTIDKVKRFGPRIMEVLAKFWTIMDEKEHNDIVKQLEILKNQQINDYNIPIASNTSSSTGYGINSPNQHGLFNTNNNRRYGGGGGGGRGRGASSTSGGDGMSSSFVNNNKQYGGGGGGGGGNYNNNRRNYKARGKVFKTPIASRAKPKTPARGTKRGGNSYGRGGGGGSSQNHYQQRPSALNSALFPKV